MRQNLAELNATNAARHAAEAPYLVGQEALVQTLAALLFARDPMGIAFEEFGNVDEYQAEAETITARRGEIADLDAARRVVFETFTVWFSPADVGREQDYQALAEDVWRALQAQG